jgi:protein transport protein SEC24
MPRSEPEVLASINQGYNAAECHIAMSCQALPTTAHVAQSSHLPTCCIVQPLASSPSEEKMPVVNFGSCNVIRCKRCRTYINPFVVWLDNGRRWKCNMCAMPNDVPSLYFCRFAF